MIRIFRQAASRLWHHPHAIVTGLIGLALVAGLAWWWLSMPVATTLHLVMLGGVALAAIALAAFLLWRAFTVFRTTAASGWRALASPAFWVALVVAAVTGAALPWSLVKWVPEIDGLWAQAASMLFRWTVAGGLFTASLLWLGAVARVIAESGNGEDLHTEERQADQAA